MAKQGPRKKLPKELAVINADNCTGCEACLEVCPVDCIVKIQQYDQFTTCKAGARSTWSAAWAAKCASTFRARRPIPTT